MIQNTIGLPRGMLFHRYETLWRTFFSELGVPIIVSEPTTQALMDKGASLALDEACLSLKVYLGHVSSLIGRCHYILIPRISNYGVNRELCPRFEALYDIVRNTFRESSQEFITYNVDVKEGRSQEGAFLEMGSMLGYSRREVKKAYAAARKAEERRLQAAIQKQDAKCKAEGLRILIAAHSYVIADPFMGKPITDFLERENVQYIRADRVDREAALKRSTELSVTCKWEMSREILGGIAMYRKKVDGIILVSTFPCGSDAMVNDLLLRKLSGIPVLNLVLDGQSGTAGLETRLESFLDIIRFKRGLL